jgi:hypothetical protein
MTDLPLTRRISRPWRTPNLSVISIRCVTPSWPPSILYPDSKAQREAQHDATKGDILYSFCQEKKVRKNKIFKNNELKIDPLFGNTSPSDSVHGFVFDFDESLTNNELWILALSLSGVSRPSGTTQHPLSRFQSSARGPGLSPTRSFTASTLVLGLLSSKIKCVFIRLLDKLD